MIRYICRLSVLLALGTGLMLTGCAGIGDFIGPVWTPGGSDCMASQVLSDCRRIAALPAAGQRSEVQRLQAELEQSGGERERLTLACLAVHPASRYQNHARGVQLLQEYPPGNQPADALALVEVLEALLLQKQRAEQQLTEERERSEALAQKLKALEDIEKIIQKQKERALPSP